MKPDVRQLPSGYAWEVDTVDEDAWNRLVIQFDDANIFQTWSYGAVRFGRKKVSHFLLKDQGLVVAAAQIRIVRVPFLGIGIAYSRWGPLWRLHKLERNVEIFRHAIRALRNEYVCRRGLVLRLQPRLFDSDGMSAILEDEGFSCSVSAERPRTFVIDLNRPLEDLRRGLRASWRRELSRAERSQLEILEGYDDKLFEMFAGIYHELVARKKFAGSHDMDEFRSIQRQLPDALKMRIMLCRLGDTLCAGLVCSALGGTGVYLFGATSTSGMKSSGSYLLHWNLLKWLKNSGCAAYDLNGVSQTRNPGTYKFKVGLCGENGRDVQFLGRFDAYSNVVGHCFVNGGEALTAIYRTIRRIATGAGLKKVIPSLLPRYVDGRQHDSSSS